MNQDQLQTVSNRLQVILVALCIMVTCSFWLSFFYPEFWIFYGYYFLLAFISAISIGRINDRVYLLSLSDAPQNIRHINWTMMPADQPGTRTAA